MSETNITAAVDGIFADALSEDPRIAEEFVTVEQAALIQQLAPGHWLTPERALAGLALQRGEIDVPEYARRIGKTAEEVREHFLKCGMTEDGQMPEDGPNRATFDYGYVQGLSCGYFGEG